MKKTKPKYFYGITGILFIWNGAYSDPHVEYKNQRFNYYDLEDYLYSIFKEEMEEKGVTETSNDVFLTWIQKEENTERAISCLDEMGTWQCQKSADNFATVSKELIAENVNEAYHFVKDSDYTDESSYKIKRNYTGEEIICCADDRDSIYEMLREMAQHTVYHN